MVDHLVERPEAQPKPEDTRLTEWQNKLLPLMVGMLIVLTAFFCISNMVQVHVLNKHIMQAEELNLEPALSLLIANEQSPAAEKLEYARWKTKALLEERAMRYRYHEASVASLGRAYLIYLGFTVGMVMAMVGATFILGKLKESESKAAAVSSLVKVSITSASPGLILAALGTVLMLVTVRARSEAQVTDTVLYVYETPRPINAITNEANRVEKDSENKAK